MRCVWPFANKAGFSTPIVVPSLMLKAKRKSLIDDLCGSKCLEMSALKAVWAFWLEWAARSWSHACRTCCTCLEWRKYITPASAEVSTSSDGFSTQVGLMPVKDMQDSEMLPTFAVHHSGSKGRFTYLGSILQSCSPERPALHPSAIHVLS